MNYLAHAYLSFNNADILVGNLISDFVKGKKKFDYPLSIQKGISLHRMIDEFTDSHPATNEAKKFFKPAYGLYAGAFMDIAYDHFLANDKKEFAENGLQDFARQTYGLLNPYITLFPEKFRIMFHYMKLQNWLYNYQFEEGIRNSFIGLVRRAKFMNEAQSAFAIFKDHYPELRNCYDMFFPDIKKFALATLEKLNASNEISGDISESI